MTHIYAVKHEGAWYSVTGKNLPAKPLVITVVDANNIEDIVSCHWKLSRSAFPWEHPWTLTCAAGMLAAKFGVWPQRIPVAEFASMLERVH